MQTLNREKYYWLFSSIVVLLCCLFLFWIDHETKSVANLVQPGSLVALVIYFIPTFLLCSFLYFLLHKIMSWDKSFTLAHFIGIPAGLTFVILLLSWSMGQL
jgi:hypothetical protein